MTDRKKQLTDIFQAAIERDAGERAAYVAKACAGDEALRREVEALVASHESAGSFIESPAYTRVAGLLDNNPPGSLVGQSIAQYRLLSLLGAGGMGEVYLADDTKLDRKTAVKVLPAPLTADHAQVGRFQQEARAASALNHPNIVTIYEINEVDGRQYIASEYIEGETLRDRMSRELTLGQALEIASQIAGALTAAHSAGVVHRDIKPENVMLRPDGYVKVLDFGIAKLTERQRSATDDEAPTRALVQTAKGVVLGTAHYMSPEQARGVAVDTRTDIWSLGAMLHEMVTGSLPFPGETVSDCIASILKTEPPPLTELVPGVPVQLEWVVQKALRKDRDERYQTAKELLSDLRAVKQEVPGGGARVVTGVNSGAQVVPAGTATDALAPSTADARRTTSSAEYIVGEIKRHRTGALLASLALIVIVAGGGYALYKYAWQKKSAPPIFQNVEVTRITTSGRASEANISPDGRYVVYVEGDEAGNSGILVKQTATGNTLQIVAPSKVSLAGTVFSPDSTFVYYLMNDLSSEITGLYQVPSIGGTPRKILADVDGPAAISPDGRRFAFVREEKDVKFDLVVANADGTGERVLATRQGTDWFQEEGPAWSPDGKTIACAAGSSPTGSAEFKLLGIDIATGAIRELSPKRWLGYASRVVWMPDGAALALIATEHVENDRNQVWRISYPAGEASRVTNDVQSRNSRSLGVTADGRTLVTVTQQTVTRIETMPEGGDISRVVRLTTGAANREGYEGVAWTADGRIVFASSEGSQPDIWIMNADGSGRKRLTSDSFWDGTPAVSADNRYVVFATNRAKGGASTTLWRMDLDGGNLMQLTTGEDSAPDISPDGRWVIYSSWSPGPKGITGQTMWKVSIDGGTPVQLTDYNSQVPDYSPDGNLIVSIVYDDQVTPKRWRTGIIPATGGTPMKQFDRPNYNYQYARWTPDGRNLSFIGQPAVPSNIWLQPVAGGEPHKLTDFKSEMIFRHAWSPDGRMLAVVRGNVMTDVVLMRDASIDARAGGPKAVSVRRGARHI